MLACSENKDISKMLSSIIHRVQFIVVDANVNIEYYSYDSKR